MNNSQIIMNNMTRTAYINSLIQNKDKFKIAVFSNFNSNIKYNLLKMKVQGLIAINLPCKWTKILFSKMIWNKMIIKIKLAKNKR